MNSHMVIGSIQALGVWLSLACVKRGRVQEGEDNKKIIHNCSTGREALDF
ncbi:MAG: hypothetical protein JXB48_07790 [Candidatus Latescibacteria bacterium]|nr:hypothetical protein [Candidatus Latescibacterota bacterium]